MAKKLVEPNTTIQTVTADGKAPKRRIPTVAAAQTAYQSLWNADIIGGRDVRFASIAGLAANYPPTPPAEMERNGNGDMPNVNIGDFLGALNDYADVWNQINASNLNFYKVEADELDPKQPDPIERERRSEYLTKCFNWALQTWEDPPKDGFFNHSGRYILESSIRDMQMGMFGIGISIFRDPVDFRFKSIETRKVFVPEGTNIAMDNCPLLAIRDEMSASQLWAMKGKKGWNDDAIIQLLYYNQGARNQFTQDQQTYAQWVEWTRENESYILTDFSQIPFIHLYCRELDSGKISHCCFSNLSASQAKEPKDMKGNKIKQMGWLYEAPEKDWADSWNQAVAVFSDNVGAEGKWHGVKGFGDRNYDMCHYGNQMFNETARATLKQNMLIFQSMTENDKQKLEQVTFSNGSILLPDLQMNQVKLSFDIPSSMAMFDLGNRIRMQNNRKFPMNERTRTGEAPTATQVNTDTAKEAQFTSLQIAFYRSTGADKLGAEMYRRLAQPASKYPESWPGGKVAKRFREQAAEYGIEDKDLLKVRRIYANRDSGSGNMGIDLMKGKELLAVATPGPGQWQARHKIASVLVGADMADAFVEPIPEAPTEIDRTISNENNFIMDGKSPIVLPNDPHEVHVLRHLEIAQQLQQVIAAVMQQGVTPQNVEDAVLLHGKLESAIEHIGAHVNFMSELRPVGGRAGLFQQIVQDTTKTLNALQQLAQSFGQDIQKALAEKQQTQAAQSPEMMKAQQEMQIAAMKAEVEIQIKKMNAEAKLGNLAISHQARTEMKKAQAEQDLGIQAMKSTAEQELNAAKTNQELEENAALAIQGITQSALDHQVALAQEQELAANKPKPTK